MAWSKVVGSWSNQVLTRHRAKARRMKTSQQTKQRGFSFNGLAGASIDRCRLFWNYVLTIHADILYYRGLSWQFPGLLKCYLIIPCAAAVLFAHGLTWKKLKCGSGWFAIGQRGIMDWNRAARNHAIAPRIAHGLTLLVVGCRLCLVDVPNRAATVNSRQIGLWRFVVWRSKLWVWDLFVHVPSRSKQYHSTPKDWSQSVPTLRR